MALLGDRPVSVFEQESFSVKPFKVQTSDASRPPKELFIVTPIPEGLYPVLLFFHGTCLLNSSYSDILQHISSHGYIVVAPQCYYPFWVVPQCNEVHSAGEVTNWLPTGLPSILPNNVLANLDMLALSGHSRGGKTAFCLILGYCNIDPCLKFKGLIGIDPVSGGMGGQLDPKILTYVPQSFDLGIPVCVYGSGLGSKRQLGILPACAPDGMNHSEFFRECKPPCSYFVAKDYGHMDLLDEGMANIGGCMCKSGQGCKKLLRKGVGGIVVAFLKACLEGKETDFLAIVENPDIAPIKLDPVTYIPEKFSVNIIHVAM